MNVNQKFKMEKFYNLHYRKLHGFYLDSLHMFNCEKQCKLIFCRNYLRVIVFHKYSQLGFYINDNGIVTYKPEKLSSYLRMLVIHTYSQHGSYSTYNEIVQQYHSFIKVILCNANRSLVDNTMNI
ncbi:hypothetical protein V1477_011438 [Vespula maculifrons]|uniref:Uncharacterized protein n=1 Tax=Vespula maculifrons TaxID=7453 RepID=A0ABD2BZA3_VESMC